MQYGATILARNQPHDFHTLSAFEGHQYVRRASFGNELLSPGKVERFQLSHKRLRLGQVMIDMVQIDCGSSFEVIQVEQLGFYTFKIPLEGVSEYRVEGRKQVALPGHLFATNPVENIRKRFIGRYSQIILTVPQDRLEAFLTKELARPLREPLEFDLRPHRGSPSDQFIRSVQLLWMDLDAATAHPHARVVSHLENALLASMLMSVPNNYSGDLDHTHDEIAPYYIRKAESFIHGHLGEEVSIDDIVTAAGASSRSLYYGFRRWRQTTPMGYLKAARLERARAELTQASLAGETSVTNIALRVGYHHLNHFSCDYKARFGERPSDTLRQN